MGKNFISPCKYSVLQTLVKSASTVLKPCIEATQSRDFRREIRTWGHLTDQTVPPLLSMFVWFVCLLWQSSRYLPRFGGMAGHHWSTSVAILPSHDITCYCWRQVGCPNCVVSAGADFCHSPRQHPLAACRRKNSWIIEATNLWAPLTWDSYSLDCKNTATFPLLPVLSIAVPTAIFPSCWIMWCNI